MLQVPCRHPVYPGPGPSSPLPFPPTLPLARGTHPTVPAVCACVHACMCVRMCMHACACMCVCVCMRACACMCVRVCVCRVVTPALCCVTVLCGLFGGVSGSWGEDLEEAHTPALGTRVSYQTPGRQQRACSPSPTEPSGSCPTTARRSELTREGATPPQVCQSPSSFSSVT